MVRRRFSPKSRQFDEREIRRRYTKFSKGMFRQEDTEGTDIPDGGMADLINCRAKGDSVEGRPGSRLFTPADFGLSITGGSESLTTAMTSGELYTANGDAIPAAGDIFMVYGTGDFSTTDLATAKGSAPRKWDCFKITSATAGYETLVYVGRLCSPALTGYGDTPATEFSLSKSGSTVTKVSGSASFDATHVDHYINWADGTRDLITEYISASSVGVLESVTARASSYAFIQAPMNASLFHKSIGKVIALFGSKLYISTSMPFCGWTEIAKVGDTSPNNSAESFIFPYDDDAILINTAGIFKIMLASTGYYFYKANISVPATLITDDGKAAGDLYKYRYTYTYARLDGGTAFLDRSDGVSGVELVQESAPCKATVNRIDYGECWTSEPVGDSSETIDKVAGTTLSSSPTDYQDVATWAAIADGSFILSINSTSYFISVDLTGVETLGDVAYRVQMAIRQYEALKDVTFELKTGPYFLLKTGVNDTYGGCSAGTSGTNIRTALGFASPTTTVDSPTTTPYALGTLIMPVDSVGNVTANGVTHFGVYRTKNCAPEKENPHLFTWVGDIPIAKAFRGYLYDGAFYAASGTFEQEDVGATLTMDDGTTTATITAWVSNTLVSVDNVSSTAISNWCIGGGDTLSGTKEAKVVTWDATSASYYSVLAAGDLLFWADGTIDIVKSVDSSTQVTVVASGYKAATAFTAHPVSRRFTDRISDDVLDTRISAWPLRNRFHEEIPSGDVGTVAPNYVVTALRDENVFRYCDTTYKWMLGYYHPAFQKNDDIWDGVQNILAGDGYLVIRGKVNTYKISTINTLQVGEAAVGESLQKLVGLKDIPGIGSFGHGGAAFMGNNKDILVTSEPAVRVFNGETYDDNLAAKRIQKNDLQKMKRTSYIGAYDPVLGYILWGKQES